VFPLFCSPRVYILWHVDPLLGNDWKNIKTTTVIRQWPINNNRGRVFSPQTALMDAHTKTEELLGEVFSVRSVLSCLSRTSLEISLLWDSRWPVRVSTQKLRKLQCWKPLPGDNWWRHRSLRRLSTCCIELQSMWISNSAIVTCSYVLQEFSKSNYQSKPRLQSPIHVTLHTYTAKAIPVTGREGP
jgi:hypothetical protein